MVFALKQPIIIYEGMELHNTDIFEENVSPEELYDALEHDPCKYCGSRTFAIIKEDPGHSTNHISLDHIPIHILFVPSPASHFMALIRTVPNPYLFTPHFHYFAHPNCLE